MAVTRGGRLADCDGMSKSPDPQRYLYLSVS